MLIPFLDCFSLLSVLCLLAAVAEGCYSFLYILKYIEQKTTLLKEFFTLCNLQLFELIIAFLPLSLFR